MHIRDQTCTQTWLPTVDLEKNGIKEQLIMKSELVRIGPMPLC